MKILDSTDTGYLEVEKQLIYLGYGDNPLSYVVLGMIEENVVVVDYPNVDHYNGVPEGILKLFYRDIDKAVKLHNKSSVRVL